MRDPDKQWIKLKRLRENLRSSTAAEKSDEGMALKIRTRAEDMSVGKETF